MAMQSETPESTDTEHATCIREHQEITTSHLALYEEIHDILESDLVRIDKLKTQMIYFI